MSTNTAEKKHIYLSDLHTEHVIWLKELSFYKEEVAIYELRLEEMVSRNTGSTMLAQAEQFQNQFVRQKEVVDILHHDIKAHEAGLVQHAKDHPVAIEHQYFKDHSGLRDQVVTFRKIYAELKDNFYRFMVEWM